MVDRLAQVESRLEAIERRLGALERGSREARPIVQEIAPETLAEGTLSRAATYLGRVLLIFGGAYLLRAITDSGLLPIQAGIPIGASYALLWLFMAYRAAAHEDRRTGATIYGAVSVLMSLPILVEAVTRFELLSGPQSAFALIACCAIYLAVAALRDLRLLAWLVVTGGLLTGTVLAKASGAVLPFVVFFVILGLISLWIVYLRRWRGLQWLGAAGANLGVFALLVLSSNGNWSIMPATALLLAAALSAGFLLSFMVRSHLQGHPPGVFEAAQAAAVTLLALGTTFYAVHLGGVRPTPPGVLALALGVGCYALAFTRETRAHRGRGHYFYSTLGLALVVGGSALLTTPAKAAVAWALLAVVMAWSSGRHRRVSLSLHCTLLLMAACLGSGVLATGVAAFAGAAAASWPALSVPEVLVAALAVACLFIPVAQSSDRWGTLAFLPQLVVLALAGWSVGGLVITVLAPALAGVPGPSADLGKLAALRTAVLAAAAISMALSSRHPRWPEARWLAYPVLVIAGIKMLLEDFPSGRPLTLFIALALLGGAMILVSKALPRRGAELRAS
jgi:hypothetical protein